jgi:Ser/Thr protein kinase RdoA (MazF antagonist)
MIGRIGMNESGSALAASCANVGVGLGLIEGPHDESSKPRPATTSSWDIYLARHMPAKWLGTVEATDADAAIEQAVKEFDVTDPKTLIAVRRR